MGLFRYDFQGLVGVILFVASFYALSISIAVFPGCKFSEETPLQCSQNVSNSIVQLSEIVSFEGCFGLPIGGISVDNIFQFAFFSNVQLSDKCRLYGCSGGCLKTSTPCVEGTPVYANSAYSCESSLNTNDARPLSVFLYPPFFIIGLLLLFLTRDFRAPTLIGLLVVFYGSLYLERSIDIVRGCPWSQETYSQCATGKGQVTNSKIVSLSLCQYSVASVVLSPFATNVRNSPSCLTYGCSPNQCLKTTQYCPGPIGDTYECVAQQSESFAAPVQMFFALIIILVGIAICIVGRRHSNEHQPLLEN